MSSFLPTIPANEAREVAGSGSNSARGTRPPQSFHSTTARKPTTPAGTVSEMQRRHMQFAHLTPAQILDGDEKSVGNDGEKRRQAIMRSFGSQKRKKVPVSGGGSALDEAVAKQLSDSHDGQHIPSPPTNQQSIQGSTTASSVGKEGRLKWEDTQGGIKSKALLAAEIETMMAKTCLSPSIPVQQRVVNFGAVLEEVTHLVPAFNSLFGQLRGFLLDLGSGLARERQQLHKANQDHRVTVAAERDELYKEKFLQLNMDNRNLKRTIARLENELKEVRRSRDEELTEVKNRVWDAIKQVYSDTMEQQSMRTLLTAVFRTNQEMQAKVRELETGIVAPRRRDGEDTPTNSGGMGGKKRNGRNDEDEGPVLVQKQLHAQVPLDFIQASKREIEASRLSTQRILVQCASESQSTFKLMLDQKCNEVDKLKDENTKLRNDMQSFEELVHARRFLQDMSEDPDAPEDETEDEKNLRWLESGRLTPRPSVPFEVQSELGVNLRRSSTNIVSELSSIAVKQRKELNDAHLRIRRLSLLANWMDDSIVSQMSSEGDVPFLKPEGQSDWATIAHFLRTYVDAEIPNNRWTAIETAKILRSFFKGFEGYLHASRCLNDDKVCAPKVVQQWERFRALGARLDANVKDMGESAANVPCGYVVTTFIKEYLASGAKKKANAAARVKEGLTSEFVHEVAGTHGGDRVANAAKLVVDAKLRSRSFSEHVEFEFACFAYNLWHAVRRYRHCEPLCELFILVLEGQLPYEAFNTCTKAVERVHETIQAQDAIKSNVVSYRQLSTALLTTFLDQPGSVWREVMLAGVETMSANAIPLQGKIAIADVVATEVHHQGPSLLTRFVRHHVLQTYNNFYHLIEERLRPLIFESSIRPGLMLIHIEKAVSAIKAMQLDIAPKLAIVEAAPILTVGGEEGSEKKAEVIAIAGEDPKSSSSPDAIKPSLDTSTQPISLLTSPAHQTNMNLSPSNISLDVTPAGSRVASPANKLHSQKQYDLADQMKTKRIASPQADFVTFVGSILRGCPRLNASVHCAKKEKKVPAASQDDQTPSSRRAKSKRKAKVASNSSTAAIVEAVNDQELTEWYAAMQMMRLTPVDFHDKLNKKIIDGSATPPEASAAFSALTAAPPEAGASRRSSVIPSKSLGTALNL